MSQDKNVQNVFTAGHLFSILLTMQCVTSKYISSEISKSEEGGRRGVLLPGKERCRARAVSPTNDGSLWVSERLSQCFDRPLLKLFLFLEKNKVYVGVCTVSGEMLPKRDLKGWNRHGKKQTLLQSLAGTSGQQVQAGWAGNRCTGTINDEWETAG